MEEKQAVKVKAVYRLELTVMLAQPLWFSLKFKLCLNLSGKWITKLALNDRNNITGNVMSVHYWKLKSIS